MDNRSEQQHHPTKAGYREWWCPELEKQLLAYYDSLEK